VIEGLRRLPRRRLLAALLVVLIAGTAAVLALSGGGSGDGEQAAARLYSDGEVPPGWPEGLEHPGEGVVWSAAERPEAVSITFAMRSQSVVAASGWRATLEEAGYSASRPAKVGPGVWVLRAERDGTVLATTVTPFPDPRDRAYRSLALVSINR
jgi:hypothetical protein